MLPLPPQNRGPAPSHRGPCSSVLSTLLPLLLGRPGLGSSPQEVKSVGEQDCGDSSFPLPFPPFRLDAHPLFPSKPTALLYLYPLCSLLPILPKALGYRRAGPSRGCSPSFPTAPVQRRLYAGHRGVTSPLPTSCLPTPPRIVKMTPVCASSRAGLVPPAG